jgi:hypothetical protein
MTSIEGQSKTQIAKPTAAVKYILVAAYRRRDTDRQTMEADEGEAMD